MNLRLVITLRTQINPSVNRLEFRCGSTSEGGVSQICATLLALSTADSLQSGPRIMKLNFNGNTLDNAGAESCAELIRVSTWLQELRLANCGLSPQAVTYLVYALRESSSMHLLDLIGNRTIGLDGCIAIGALLSVKSSLKILDLGYIVIDGDGFKAITDGLKVNTSLQQLHLVSIGPNCAVKFLADALRENSSLCCLNLSRSGISDDSAKLLSAALCENSGLERLDLGFNRIGDRGAASFCAALRVNTRLQALDFSSNMIGDPGAALLGIALSHNSSLTCIHLGKNRIGDGGAAALAEALCKNPAMTTLGIENNKIGQFGADRIRKAQLENSRLEPISLTGNPCDANPDEYL